MSETKELYITNTAAPTEAVEMQRRVIQLARELAASPDCDDLFTLFKATFYTLKGRSLVECPENALSGLARQLAAHPDRAALFARFEEDYRTAAVESREREILESGHYRRVGVEE